METINIRTTQNIDIEYEIGGLGERTLGRLIDYAVFIPLFILFAIIAPQLGGIGVYVAMYILLGLFGFYDLLCEVFFNGQSVGKKVMKIRVISLDGGRPTFGQYLLRWLFRLVDFGISGQLCGLITAAASEKCQRLGDIVAGTILVRTVPRAKRENIVYYNVQDDYQPVFPQVIQLSEKDIALVHEVVQNYFQTGGNTALYTLADKVRAHLLIARPPGMNEITFMQTVLKDYSHLASATDQQLTSN